MQMIFDDYGSLSYVPEPVEPYPSDFAQAWDAPEADLEAALAFLEGEITLSEEDFLDPLHGLVDDGNGGLVEDEPIVVTVPYPDTLSPWNYGEGGTGTGSSGSGSGANTTSLTDFNSCKFETLVDRFALQLAERLRGMDEDVEHGFFIVRQSNGALRAVGPVNGFRTEAGVESITWNASPSSLGISDWSQLVGLIHTHPRESGGGSTLDGNRDQLSDNDIRVKDAFINAGASAVGFRQYIVAGSNTLQFDPEDGRSARDVVTGAGCG